MNRLRYIFASAIIAIANVVLGGETETNEVLRVVLNLSDGSRIIGTPDIEFVPVETAYAKINVPLRQILAIKMEADHERASFDLMNGDKLKGVINIGPLKVVTIFGKASVGVEHIRELRTLVPGVGPVEGLIAWYRFHDGTAHDSSSFRNHGVVHGAKPAPDRNQRADHAMSFDGKRSWIEVPSSAVYDSIAEISIALWVCPVDDQREERTSYSLVSKQPSGSLSQQHGPTTSNHGGLFDLEMNVNDGCGQVYFSSQVSPGMCSEGHNARMQPLPMGRWHHVAVTASKAENRVKVYVDGRKVDDVVLSSQVQVGHILSQPNKEPLRIGKRKDGDFNRFYFCGSMDDIRIYNRVLSDLEVEQVCGTGN